MKLNRVETAFIGFLVGIFVTAAFFVVLETKKMSDNVTSPPISQDTVELQRVVDSIRVQTPMDRLALEQRILQKAREEK